MSAMEGPPNHPKTFGEELRRLRESAGLSVDDIIGGNQDLDPDSQQSRGGGFSVPPAEGLQSELSSPSTQQCVGADPHRLAESFEAAWERFLLASGTHIHGFMSEETPFIRQLSLEFLVAGWTGGGDPWSSRRSSSSGVQRRGSSSGAESGTVSADRSRNARRVSPTAPPSRRRRRSPRYEERTNRSEDRIEDRGVHREGPAGQ